MRKVFLIVCTLVVLAAAGCRPAAAPVSNTPAPSSNSPLSLPTPIAPQAVPGFTREVPLSPASTPFADSGVRLTATIGPTCPGPERPGQVCTRPYEGLFVVTDNAGVQVARASTDQHGMATIVLPPGNYVITPKIEGRFPSGAPVTVTVFPDQYVQVSIGLDSGIR